MTKALVDATARLEQATAEVEAIEAYEAEWSAEARRARLERLREEQLAAADAEATELKRLAAEASALAEELEPMYADAAIAMEAFVLQAEKILDVRAEYEQAWRRARAAGVAVAPLVPKADARAARERGPALELVRRLQIVQTRGW